MAESTEIHVHVHIHRDEDDHHLLRSIAHNQERTLMDLSVLTAAVEASTSAEQSAITLITEIAAELKAAAGDQTAVDALADQLVSGASALGTAVTANTEPAPIPDPAPPADVPPVDAPPADVPPADVPPADDGQPVDPSTAEAPPV